MNPLHRRYQEGLQAGMTARAAHERGLTVPVSSIPLMPPPPAPTCTDEERIKRELHPLDAFPRLIACAEGNLPPDPDDRFRFLWFGLKYLAPDKDGFRLRVRVPGGDLRTYQVREAADIARTCASGCMEINRYAGLDMKTVALPDALAALSRAVAAGLTTRGASGDNVIAIMSNPLSGLDQSGLIDVNPLVGRLAQCFSHGREFMDLPRACTIVLDEGGDGGSVDAVKGDIRFTASKPCGQGTVFRVEVAGLGDLGTWLRPDQVVHACIELLRVFIREVDRADRDQARMDYFYGTWGQEQCLATLETMMGTKLPRWSPVPSERPGPKRPPEHAGCPTLDRGGTTLWSQKQPGLFTIGLAAPTSGWLSAQWDEIAHLADIFGSGRLRLTVGNTLLLPGVLEKHVKPLREQLNELGCA